jgi:proteic killer suppression protein
MILSFACKETEVMWAGKRSRQFPSEIQERALRKLRQLDAARTLDDLRLSPSNYLEVLRGNRKGQMSIRVNQQWRLCFVWDGNDARDVHIVDYH